MRALILQHLDREGPDLIAEVCAARGLDLELRRLDLGDEVPPELAPDNLLIVMGGPMGVSDVADPRYPFLRREVELLRSVLRYGQPVLGVCLGAQLLAYAAGARVFPNRRPDGHGVPRPWPEVGFGEVRLVDQASEAVLAGLPSPLPVLHWHGDTFDIPAGAVRLAESDACPNQAFRIGRRAFGLQFHVEVSAELARRWAREDADFVRAALGPDGPAAIVAASERAVAAMREPGRRLLDGVIEAML
jgi:GMP synthase (glutamine-hydrolysing)